MATTTIQFNPMSFNPGAGLAGRLIRDGLLTEAEAERARTESAKEKVGFVTWLVRNRVLTSQAIAWAAGLEFGLPVFDLDAIDPETMPQGVIGDEMVRKHNALPVYRRGSRLYVAVSDPTNLAAIDDIKFHTNLSTLAVLVEDDKLARLIEKALDRAAESSFKGLDDTDLDNLDISGGDEAPAAEDSGGDVEDAPIVRFVNSVLLSAINKGASDIHFEPYEKQFRVRFRQDGMLHETTTLPMANAPRIAARLKVMARLDIAERRVPQDGRIKMKLSKNRSIDFRVNTCPTLYGEKIVMRILDPTSAQLGIEALGFDEDQRATFESAIAKPYGMILVTGPTGSGKTVTLYTALNMLNSVDRNISTVEDPVEINVPGINQVNMNVKTGLTFAEALRAFLRQDPDVIMVGEVRDLETAEIAVKAAQTGHLVLSTLHTNDAPQTLTRLANMGIPAYNIASSVHLIMAQRLARRLCTQCRTEASVPREALLHEGFREEDIGNFKLYNPVGCPNCTNGYKGRVGIYQVMPVSGEMGKIILGEGNAIALAEQARREGVRDLRQSGLRKVMAGVTSLAEINRITKD